MTRLPSHTRTGRARSEDFMATNTKEVSDLLLLIPFIAGHPGVTVGEVARHLGCTRARVEGHLNRILMCGVPPYLPDNYIGYAREGDRIFLTLASHMSHPVRLTLEEALGLRLLLQALPPAGKGRSPAATLLKKIESALAAGAGREFHKMSRAIALAEPGTFDWKKIFADATWFHLTGITPAISASAAALSMEAVQTAAAMGLTITPPSIAMTSLSTIT